MCIIIFAVETLASKTLSDYCRKKTKALKNYSAKRYFGDTLILLPWQLDIECFSMRVYHECLSGLGLATVPLKVRGNDGPLDFILTQNKVIICEHP